MTLFIKEFKMKKLWICTGCNKLSFKSAKTYFDSQHSEWGKPLCSTSHVQGWENLPSMLVHSYVVVHRSLGQEISRPCLDLMSLNVVQPTCNVATHFACMSLQCEGCARPIAHVIEPFLCPIKHFTHACIIEGIARLTSTMPRVCISQS